MEPSGHRGVGRPAEPRAPGPLVGNRRYYSRATPLARQALVVAMECAHAQGSVDVNLGHLLVALHGLNGGAARAALEQVGARFDRDLPAPAVPRTDEELMDQPPYAVRYGNELLELLDRVAAEASGPIGTAELLGGLLDQDALYDGGLAERFDIDCRRIQSVLPTLVDDDLTA